MVRVFRGEATGETWYDLTSQAFAVFLPVKSVGVMGDSRTHDHAVALRAVQTNDFVTADWTCVKAVRRMRYDHRHPMNAVVLALPLKARSVVSIESPVVSAVPVQSARPE